jgi:hypothetical protein
MRIPVALAPAAANAKAPPWRVVQFFATAVVTATVAFVTSHYILPATTQNVPALQAKPALGPITGPRRHFADNVEDAIRQAAQSSGLDVGMLRAFADIESGGNPSARTGSYHGLFQLSQAEFAALGGKKIYDPWDNARIAAIKLKREAHQFARKLGRSPTPFDLYMVHQRGLAGYEQHLKSPDALAWTALYNTAEGRQKGEGWAHQTITQNLPRSALERMGGVEKITNKQFVEWWRSRFEREAGRGTSRGAAILNSQTGQRSQVLANVSVPESGKSAASHAEVT